MYLLFLTIKLFLCFYSLLFLDILFMLYPFYDLMIFIYNPNPFYESSKSLEGDCGMDKVPRSRLLRPFQEGTHNNKSEKI